MFCNRHGVVGYSGPTPETSRKALELSIEKWRFIAETIEEGTEIWNCGYGDTCGLCRFHHTGSDCGDCVVKRDGHDGCQGTPYQDFCDENTAANAWDEVYFLESLRDV